VCPGLTAQALTSGPPAAAAEHADVRIDPTWGAPSSSARRLRAICTLDLGGDLAPPRGPGSRTRRRRWAAAS
jgi:hypothetical protein